MLLNGMIFYRLGVLIYTLTREKNIFIKKGHYL